MMDEQYGCGGGNSKSSENYSSGRQQQQQPYSDYVVDKKKMMEYLDVDDDDDESVEDYENLPTYNDNNSSDDDNESTFVQDQLPTVEEIKTNNALMFGGMNQQSSSSRYSQGKKRVWCWYIGAAFVLFIALITLIVVSIKRHHYEKAIKSITKTVRISKPDDLKNSKSSQSMALKWMLYDDEMKLPLPKQHDDPFVQRYIIATMAFSVASTTSQQELGLLDTNQHECFWNSQWKRLDDDHAVDTITMGIICNEDNNIVTSIVMKRVGIHGELPTRELESLQGLTHFEVDGNSLMGQIPIMPYLTHLSLSYNSYTGYIPNFWSQMTRLETMNLAENAFQGSIPRSFKALSHLHVLALNGNEITSGLADLYELTNLQELYVQYNSFEDHLSNGSFEKLTNLKVLDLKSNRISGPLPDALWDLTNLEVIDAHHNALDGHINNVIVPNHPLKFLDISNNFLGGGLPSSISNLLSLSHLDLSYNRFDELLPEQYLANMTKMRTLLLTENDMFGPQPLPDWLRQMTDLQRMSFRLTSRTGTIPTWFGELTELELLDLDWNHVSGTIPTELAQLTHLKYLMLNRNLMNGEIPTEVSSLPNLKILMVDNNDFSGELDACHVPFLIADCGDPGRGCPDCDSNSQKIACPCCTDCCFVSADRCNMDDWVVVQAEDDFRGMYDSSKYTRLFDNVSYIPAPK